MTSVTGTTFQPPVREGAPTEAPSQELGQQEFLKLLMTQMANQDPLNPMDSDQFMNQITSMNSLQQQIATNERLDDLVLAMGALNNETAVNLVGRSVVVEGDAFPHTAGESDELVFELAAEAATVDITVIDADGKVVDVITREDAKAGEQSVSWDGWDDDIKAPFPEGDYTFRVSAKDADGNPVAARTFVRGLVTELRFDGGTPQVVVGGHPFLLSAIDRVLGGEPVGGAAAADASDASDDPSADPPDPAADPELAPGVTAANLSALKASLSALGFLQ